jgi:hypothetical protein
LASVSTTRKWGPLNRHLVPGADFLSRRENIFRPKVYASLSRSGAKRSTRGSDWLAMSDFDKSRRYKAQAKRWGRLLPKSALSPFGHLSRIDWHVRLELAVLAVDRPCGTRSAT